jgi:hypothetical protein
MIAKFETTAGGKKGNTLLMLALLAVGGYLVYQYVLKPKQTDKQNQ